RGSARDTSCPRTGRHPAFRRTRTRAGRERPAVAAPARTDPEARRGWLPSDTTNRRPRPRCGVRDPRTRHLLRGEDAEVLRCAVAGSGDTDHVKADNCTATFAHFRGQIHGVDIEHMSTMSAMIACMPSDTLPLATRTLLKQLDLVWFFAEQHVL